LGFFFCGPRRSPLGASYWRLILKLNPETEVCQGMNEDTEKLTFTVEEGDKDKRLDQFVRERLKDVSRSQIQKWIHGGAVLCEGSPAAPAHTVTPGETVS